MRSKVDKTEKLILSIKVMYCHAPINEKSQSFYSNHRKNLPGRQ